MVDKQRTDRLVFFHAPTPRIRTACTNGDSEVTGKDFTPDKDLRRFLHGRAFLKKFSPQTLSERAELQALGAPVPPAIELSPARKSAVATMQRGVLPPRLENTARWLQRSAAAASGFDQDTLEKLIGHRRHAGRRASSWPGARDGDQKLRLRSWAEVSWRRDAERLGIGFRLEHAREVLCTVPPSETREKFDIAAAEPVHHSRQGLAASAG